MGFGEAFELVKKGGRGIRLTQWAADRLIKVQYPDAHSKMTVPYLYIESKYFRAPWKADMVELFSENWEVVE